MRDDRPFLGAETVLARSLGSSEGLAVADIGCGGGRIARVLAGLGADVTGIEPNADAVAAAKAEGGGPTYVIAPAERTGLPDASFDVVLFSNSLHHVPDMPAGLAEACRLLRPGGRIAVMEPEAPDPMWPVGRWIDDESAVYAAAQAAIAALETSGAITRDSTLRFASKYHVETPEQMIADMISVDSGRTISQAGRAALDAAFRKAHQHDKDGGYLEYWERMDVLSLTV